MRYNTHGLASRMNLPFEQDDVGIHAVKVVLEASYRRARRDLSDGCCDGLQKFSSIGSICDSERSYEKEGQ